MGSHISNWQAASCEEDVTPRRLGGAMVVDVPRAPKPGGTNCLPSGDLTPSACSAPVVQVLRSGTRSPRGS
jgi:hypothetical protein